MPADDYPVYFISDLHLDSVFTVNNPHRTRIDSFFRHVRQSAKTLYILGDYFDFWFEYRHVVPSRSLYGLHRLMDLLEHQVAVRYITGNHDGWARDFFPKELQIPLYHEPQILEFPPHRVMLMHGDGLHSGDRAYRMLRAFIRFPLNQWLFRWFHPGLGVPLARIMSRWSRKYGPEDFDESADPRMNEFYRKWFGRNIDVIMMGHNHRPSVRDVGGKTVMVLGDWVKHFSYAVYDGKSIRLEFWKEQEP